MEKENKKAAIKAYKERRAVGGVYSITNTQTGEKHLFSTTDLHGAENRFKLTVQTGSCCVLSMQKEWNAYGAEAFCFEVMESLEQGELQESREFREDVKALLELWQTEKLETPNI